MRYSNRLLPLSFVHYLLKSGQHLKQIVIPSISGLFFCRRRCEGPAFAFDLAFEWPMRHSRIPESF